MIFVIFYAIIKKKRGIIMSGKICDLHTHSCFSDGTMTPSEIIDAARRSKVCAVAFCDHNTVLGLSEFLAAGEKYDDIIAVAGCEFSTSYGDTELHILGLFIPQERFDDITRLLAEQSRMKEQSNAELVAALNAAGYDIDLEVTKSKAKGQINRAHIASELTEKGYTASVEDAFKRLLEPECGFYKPFKRIDSFEAIRFIRSLGAAAVLAHPFLDLDEVELRRFLKEAVSAGLSGMETDYSKFDEETTALARSIAYEFGICRSGGSDFHGDRKPDIMLGTGRGELCVPYGYYEGLLDSLKDKR